jgi:hypothetical protein
MRRTIAAALAVVALAVSVSTKPAAAAEPPSQACYGQIIAGISSTWPWAHDGRQDFAPPPGAIALWLSIFGEELGISSVRDLQLLFCAVE